jgi:hypothetical protein
LRHGEGACAAVELVRAPEVAIRVRADVLRRAASAVQFWHVPLWARLTRHAVPAVTAVAGAALGSQPFNRVSVIAAVVLNRATQLAVGEAGVSIGACLAVVAREWKRAYAAVRAGPAIAACAVTGGVVPLDAGRVVGAVCEGRTWPVAIGSDAEVAGSAPRAVAEVVVLWRAVGAVGAAPQVAACAVAARVRVTSHVGRVVRAVRGHALASAERIPVKAVETSAAIRSRIVPEGAYAAVTGRPVVGARALAARRVIAGNRGGL